MSYEYFEKSADIVRDINRSDTIELQVGSLLGEGAIYRTSALGSIVLGDTELFIAIKKPKQEFVSPINRLAQDLSIFSFIQKYAPELNESMPGFTAALVRGEDHANPIAIVTEDMTHGGESILQQKPMKDESRACLAAALSGFNNPTDPIDSYALDDSFAYRNTDNEEFFIDTTPPPIINIPEVNEILHAAFRFVQDGNLSITPPENVPRTECMV